jgi:hypothetical protein
MRPRHYKWIAAAAALYLFIMWSAYRWSVAQRPTDGNLFEQINRKGYARLAAERTKTAIVQEESLTPTPAAQSRLNAPGPAYVAARYDATHVVFIVTTDTESRFSNSPLRRFAGSPAKVSAPAQPAAPLAGLQELWEPDSHALHFFPTIIQQTKPGDQWTLSLTSGQTIPITIDHPIIAPTGCSLALGFLASIPPAQQANFSREYFVVRHAAVESADPPAATQVAELPNWKATPAAAKQIEQQLTTRMRDELARIDASLRSNANSPGAAVNEMPLANPYPHLKEWLRADRALTRGEGVLDYDLRAFRITPDAKTRLFVRARWTLAGSPVFLMTAWFKETNSPNSKPGTPPAPPALLSADSNWSLALREGQTAATLGDDLNFQTILNQFDADHDGWAELLIHSYDNSTQPSDPSPSRSTTIALYLYTDKGLVPMKLPFRRDNQPPESCPEN